EHRGERVAMPADFVLCTVPLPLLRTLDVRPAFTTAKRRAVEQLASTSVVRVWLQVRERVWPAGPGMASANLGGPPAWLFDAAHHQPRPRGLLGAYFAGPAARQVAALPGEGRVALALDR